MSVWEFLLVFIFGAFCAYLSVFLFASHMWRQLKFMHDDTFSLDDDYLPYPKTLEGSINSLNARDVN